MATEHTQKWADFFKLNAIFFLGFIINAVGNPQLLIIQKVHHARTPPQSKWVNLMFHFYFISCPRAAIKQGDTLILRRLSTHSRSVEYIVSIETLSKRLLKTLILKTLLLI